MTEPRVLLRRPLAGLEPSSSWPEWRDALSAAGFTDLPAGLAPAPAETLRALASGRPLLDRWLVMRVGLVVGAVGLAVVLAILVVQLGLPWAEPTAEEGLLDSSFGGISRRGAVLVIGCVVTALAGPAVTVWGVGRIRPPGASGARAALAARAVSDLRPFVVQRGDERWCHLPEVEHLDGVLAVLEDHGRGLERLDVSSEERRAYGARLAEATARVETRRRDVVEAAGRALDDLGARGACALDLPASPDLHATLARLDDAASALDAWRRHLPRVG